MNQLTEEQIEHSINFLNVFCREVELEDIYAIDDKSNKSSLIKAFFNRNFKTISIKILPLEKNVGLVSLQMHDDNIKSIVTINNKSFVEKDFIDGLVRVRFEICRILNPKAFNEWGC